MQLSALSPGEDGTLAPVERPDERWRPLRQRRQRRLQLAGRGGRPRGVLRGVPAEPHHPRPVGAGNLEKWQAIEIAKRRLVYALMRLGLPLKSRREDEECGLAFDFLADVEGRRS